MPPAMDRRNHREPSDFPCVIGPWPRSDAKPKPPAKKSDAKKSSESEKKSEFVEVTAEGGDHVEPPPPEVVEPDPELSPEEAEQARKDYLLTRFWISATRLLGQERRPAGVAVFDRALDPDRRQCRLPVRHQCLEPRDLRRHREARFRHRVLSDRGVFPAGDRQRAARRGAGLHAHGHPAPLARLADQFGDVALADQRPLLPAQPRRRRPPESGISHRRGSAGRHRCAGGFRRRRHLGVPVGDDLHRGALDHRRRADGDDRRDRPSPFPASS